MFRPLPLLALGLLGLAASSPAFSFHCGTKLVHEGDTRAEVRAKCGEPADVEVRSVFRGPVVWIRGRPFFAGNDFIEIPIETWLYNLGPTRLMRRLKFQDGLLVDIETLGHGYIE